MMGLAEFETVEVVGDRIVGGVLQIWREEVNMVAEGRLEEWKW